MLKAEFCERMKNLLDGEYDAFISSLDMPAVRAVRINPIKINPDKFIKATSLSLRKIDYTENGYIVEGGGIGLGNSPEHHSGQIYIQDPGAMTAVSMLPRLSRDAAVADLCAAPGGKATDVAAKLRGNGFLLLNEYVRKRATILRGNTERLGIKNSVIVSEEVSKIADCYGAYFDAVIIDAPCSGEGMFRKDNPAREEWSLENVTVSAERQRDILKNGARLVKRGGYLVYSTCTYSLEENEMQIDSFLKENPDFILVKTDNEALITATRDGIQFQGATEKNLHLCRRFYPHVSSGEGQFAALMRRICGGDSNTLHEAKHLSPSREQLSALHDFFEKNLVSEPAGRLLVCGSEIHLLPEGAPLDNLPSLLRGVALGEVRGKLFFPHHHMFMAYADLFIRSVELSTEESALEYLRGGEIKTDSEDSGYVVLRYHGCAIGGGKMSCGIIKNHYPKGLRLPPI